MPTTSQIIHLSFAIVLFIAGTILSVALLWRDSEQIRIAAKACSWSGVVLAAGVLVWHAVQRGNGNWLPLEDNFEAFVWLGILLAVFVLYVQRAKALGGLDWFVLPIVVVLLIAAIVFGKATPHQYADETWSWVQQSGLGRNARSGREQNLVKGLNGIQRDFVIAVYFQFGTVPEFPNQVDQVVSEGVVVIKYQNFHGL